MVTPLILLLLVVPISAQQPLAVPQGQYPVPNSNPAPVLPPLQSQYSLPTSQLASLPQYPVANSIPQLSPVPSEPCNTGCPQAGATSVGYYMASDGNYYASTTAAPEEKTKGPPNRFNEQGWETDDNGNVYVGNDDAKLYLISVGSYWPFPKDYRKKREIGGLSLEQLLGFKHL